MTGEFKIDKGVPIPVFSRRAIYPWKTMDVGDSFFVPGKTTSQFGDSTNAGRRLDRKFIRRKVAGGIRVWRIE